MRGKIDFLKGTTRNLLTQNQNFIDGLRLTWLSNSTLQIETGQCYNSTNQSFMQVTAAITVNIANVGVNGRDGGAEAANTWYYVYLIKNPLTNVVAGLLSTGYPAPTTLPAGYTIFRLLGAIRNNQVSSIYNFYMHGNGRDREVLYRNSVDLNSDTVGVPSTGLRIGRYTAIGNVAFGAAGSAINAANLIPISLTRLGIFESLSTKASYGFCENLISLRTIYVIVSVVYITVDFELSTDVNGNIAYESTLAVAGQDDMSIAVRGYRFTL